jgi:copper(I)-binding protein
VHGRARAYESELPHQPIPDPRGFEMSICADEQAVVRSGRRSPSGEVTWRARLTLLATVLLCGVLAGCDAGQNSETVSETPDIPGVDGTVGTIALDDVYLETGGTVPAGGSVPLRVALTNNGTETDQLVAVSTPDAASVELLDTDGTVVPDGIEVPAGEQVDATTGPELLRLVGLSRELSPEAVVPVTFEFAKAGRITLNDVPAATSD